MPHPKLSIVTPSFNQGDYLAETIRSVFDGGCDNLEYVVIDGGSTDSSVSIIREYADRLAYWVSEPDKGHFDAVNKGFARTTGELMGWINSDDKYLPGALSVVCEIFQQFPEIQWLTTLYPIHWDSRGRAVKCKYMPGYNSKAFWRGENLPGADWKGATTFIQQESTFWRRSLWDAVGGQANITLKLGGDFELWARFYKHAELWGVAAPLGGFRSHGKQKTGAQLDRYIHECRKILLDYGGKPPGRLGSLFYDRGLKYVPDGLARALGYKQRRHIVKHGGGPLGWRLATI